MKRFYRKGYSRFKGYNGRIYWEKLSPEEITERHLFAAVVVSAPLIFIALCVAVLSMA